MDPVDEDYASPPPAYSEQNFDQKVLRATELSLHIAKWETKFELDEDGFPRYDPAMFEDKPTPVPALSGKGHPAPAPVLGSPSINPRPLPNPSLTPSTTSAGPSTLCPIAPLQITKKSLLKTQETGQVAASSFSSRESTAILRSDPNENLHPGPQTPPSYNDERSGDVQEEEDSDLGGQEIAPEQSQVETPSESQGSATTNPCTSSNHAIEQPFFRHSINTEYRQPAPQHLSMPPRGLPRIISSERPRSQSTNSTATVPHIPRVNFNSGMAYGNSTTPPPSRPIQSPQNPRLQYNPHALYNAAVSSQLNPSIATPDQSSTRSYQVQRSQVWPNQTYSPPTANINRQWACHPADGPPNNYSPLPDSSYGAGPGYAHSMTDNRYISR